MIEPVGHLPGCAAAHPSKSQRPLKSYQILPIILLLIIRPLSKPYQQRIVSAFQFQNLEGEIIKGTPDFQLFEEALKRFKDATMAMQGRKIDILEFPFSTSDNVRPANDNIFIRYHRDEGKYEIKIFHFGHYNARKILGHFFLKEPDPETRYEMTIS